MCRRGSKRVRGSRTTPASLRSLPRSQGTNRQNIRDLMFMTTSSADKMRRDPDERGYFGEFGGRFVPETLVEPIEQLERAYFEIRDDAGFQAELDRLLKSYAGRPTPLYETSRLAKFAGGARIFLKREDLT